MNIYLQIRLFTSLFIDNGIDLFSCIVNVDIKTDESKTNLNYEQIVIRTQHWKNFPQKKKLQDEDQ